MRTTPRFPTLRALGLLGASLGCSTAWAQGDEALDVVIVTAMKRETASTGETAVVENPPGVLRTTMAYNDQTMLCHFILRKGTRVPLHKHEASQNGFLIRGKLRMMWEDGRDFIALPGSGWCFDSNVVHGAEALEECEAVECFAPAREDYLPPASRGALQ